ncbi:MAG: hypothetical protein ACREIS_14825 [Nitrospiraceae bacterium]
MKFWQFLVLIAILLALLFEMAWSNATVERRLQSIQEVLEEQWTIMDSDAYGEIDRYRDMPDEPEEF